MRIGYGSYSTSFEVPGDRRRFSYYANQRGITYKYADPKKDYDFVYLTYNSDLQAWIKKKKQQKDKLKLVFELIDSYLAEPTSLKTRIRGLSRYIIGTSNELSVDFQATIG